jgi:hypothetical protein
MCRLCALCEAISNSTKYLQYYNDKVYQSVMKYRYIHECIVERRFLSVFLLCSSLFQKHPSLGSSLETYLYAHVVSQTFRLSFQLPIVCFK